MALDRITFSDNSDHVDAPARGSYTFRLHFNPTMNDAELREWNKEALGHVSAEGLFPGAVLQMHDGNEIFTLLDHTHAAIKKADARLDKTNRPAVRGIAHAQTDAKLTIAPTVPLAFMGTLMHRLISNREIEPEKAVTVIQNALSVNAEEASMAIRKAGLFASRSPSLRGPA